MSHGSSPGGKQVRVTDDIEEGTGSFIIQQQKPAPRPLDTWDYQTDTTNRI